MFWILLPENRSQNNNFFFTRIFNLSFNGLAYNTREHCVHCKRHFHRRNQGVSEYSYQRNGSNNFFCSGIINLLFDGLAYNTSGHFAHFSYFSSPLRGSEKILRNSQNIRTYYMLNDRIRCMYWRLHKIVSVNPHCIVSEEDKCGQP